MLSYFTNLSTSQLGRSLKFSMCVHYGYKRKSKALPNSYLSPKGASLVKVTIHPSFSGPLDSS